jgi:hypothetical protein
MRSIALAIILVLAFGCAQGYPLHGENEAVNCTLFGITKEPIPLQDPNATFQEYTLNLDVGLIGTRNATFELVDSKNNVLRPDLSRSRALQPGRQILTFVVPKDALFKLFKVTPSDGKPISINWWKTPKKIKGDIILRYYGIVGFRINPNEQSAAFEVGIQNNGTTNVPISPENFTLLDQWGWPYYSIEGFSPSYLDAKKSTKVRINFSSLSPQSRPATLIYDYLTNNQMAFDLDKETGPLSDALVYGINAPLPATPPAVVESTPTIQPSQAAVQNNLTGGNVSNQKSTAKENVLSLKDQINATKERLGKISKPGSSSIANSAIGGHISSSVEEAKARLAKMKEGLKSSQQIASA